MREVAIIILNYNGSSDTIDCVKSLKAMEAQVPFDVCVFDNGSMVSDYDALAECGEFDCIYEMAEFDDVMPASSDFDKYNTNIPHSMTVLVHSNINLGFAVGNNRVIGRIKTFYKYVLVLNNDTVVEKTFLKDMYDFMESNDDISFASCVINHFDDRSKLWNGGGVLLPWGNRRYYSSRYLARHGRRVDASFITGCALMVRAELIKDRHLFSEDFFFGEEDFNLCMKLRARGIKGACVNKVLVYHKVGATIRRSSADHLRIAIHFANRVVDMKKFYAPRKWRLWKKGFMAYLWLSCFRWRLDVKQRRFVLDTVERYAACDKISRDEYLEIREDARLISI